MSKEPKLGLTLIFRLSSDKPKNSGGDKPDGHGPFEVDFLFAELPKFSHVYPRTFFGVQKTRIFSGYCTAMKRSTVTATQVQTLAVCEASDTGNVTRAVRQKKWHTASLPCKK